MRASRFGWTVGAAALLLALAAGRASADLIFLKDGYVLQGKVRREGSVELDPRSKEMTFMPKGFYMIDDGPRRIYFSQSRVRIVEKMAAPSEERFVHNKMTFIVPNPMPDLLDVLDVGEWNYKTWKREYYFLSKFDRKIRLNQGLAEITPYFARVDAVSKFKWSAGYLLREWDPETVHKLLVSHETFQDPPMPTLEGLLKADRERAAREKRLKEKEKNKPKREEKVSTDDKEKPAEPVKELSAEERLRLMIKYRASRITARRLRLCDFFAQAGWFDLAERELDRLLKDQPDEKERVARARETVEKLRARDAWEQTKNWYQAGRYQAVRKRLDDFPAKKIPDRIASDMRDMKARLARMDARVKEATDALDDLNKRVMNDKSSTRLGKSLASAVRFIRAELNQTNVARLDAFLGQVRDAARQTARGKKAIQTPDGLLALAVSGWVLGSPAAEANPSFAVNLWKTRQMVIEYLQETKHSEREKILAAHSKEITPQIELDEIAQLIDLLPPVEPAKEPTEVTVERKVGGKKGISYYLRLPPEYSHSRQYPVLLVLNNQGENNSRSLDRWAKAAAEHGYILAAPKWDNGLAGPYLYSEEEHECVLETLRDLRRCFQIDSDRVFLFGLGEGGKMAFDVGLAHPDLFAGVMPMSAGPDMFPKRYWRNAQYLPFYVVSGTRAGDSNTALREQFEHWIVRSYPTLWIEYKGRGLEWLAGEVPNMFDWMRHQKRVFPLRQVGTDGFGNAFGNEFCTMRQSDDRFYWLATSGISPRNTATATRWSNLIQPAALTGRIDPDTNEIVVKTQGVNQVSIWLGRNPKGQFMIDFSKPVSVRVGLRNYINKRRIEPSLAVMLEELYKRGDRKHLFVARIDINLK
jgi:pimeloyl-ACP methyl ester carboxylesterase